MNTNEAMRWLEYATSDLRTATILLKSGEFLPTQICFHAQQAAEKAIKAILVFDEVQFPKIHDLDRLRDLIPEGWKFKQKFPDLAELTIWAIDARYQGDNPEITDKEARDALHLAESLVNEAKKELLKKQS